MTWTPHVTVAAIIERAGKFLVVEELINGQCVVNQPAGHLEQGEGLVEAVIREVREETAWRFHPDHLVGIYRMHVQASGVTYLRACFSGRCSDHDPRQKLDKDILRTLWLDHSELLDRHDTLRSPLVMLCIEDYLGGARYPLDSIKDLGNV